MAKSAWRSITTLLILTLLSACATPSIYPSGEVSAAPRLNGDHFIAHDGARIPVRTWMPEAKEPEAIVIALHGFNDYSNFFADPGNFLADRDIATYAFDQRGFGEAPAPGMWHGIPALTKDLRTLTTLVRKRHPETPLFLFGESMGGAVIMVTARQAHRMEQRLNIDGVILSAPAVWGRETMPWYQRIALWISAHTFPETKLTGRGLKIVPSDNIEMLRALGRDPLVIKETRVDAVYGLTNLMDAALESAQELDTPALVLYGEKDEIIPKEPTDLMLSRLPEASKRNRKVIFYDNGYHMLIRDLQGEVVWRDIAQWIDARGEISDGLSASGN